MDTIKALIFDLGNVIFPVDFDRCLRYWSSFTGRTCPGHVLSGEMHERFERGLLSSAEFRRYVSGIMGADIPDAEFDVGWNSIYLDEFPRIGNLLEELKKQYRLVSLTNTNIIHAPVWQERYARTLSHFEEIFSSHEIGERKPDEESYRIVLSYLGLKAREALFIDDRIENTEAAARLGLHTITVSSEDSLMEGLRKAGVHSPEH